MDNHETVSLRDFLGAKITALEEQTKLRFDSLDNVLRLTREDSKEALTLARQDAHEKYEHLNALRTEVTTDRGLLVKVDSCKQTHDSVDKEFAEVKKEIGLLRESKSQIEGRTVEKVEARNQDNWSTGLMVVGVLSLLSLIVTVIHMLKS